jgi:hypothetical protein
MAWIAAERAARIEAAKAARHEAALAHRRIAEKLCATLTFRASMRPQNATGSPTRGSKRRAMLGSLPRRKLAPRSRRTPKSASANMTPSGEQGWWPSLGWGRLTDEGAERRPKFAEAPLWNVQNLLQVVARLRPDCYGLTWMKPSNRFSLRSEGFPRRLWVPLSSPAVRAV